MTTFANELELTTPTPPLTIEDFGVGLRYPRLRLYFYSLIESDTLLFYSESGENIWFKGPVVQNLIPELLPLLSGTHTTSSIVEQLGISRKRDVVNVLKMLKERRILEEGHPELPADFPPGYAERYQEQINFLSHYNANHYAIQAHLYRANVTILDDNTSYGAELAAHLAETGLGQLKLVQAANLASAQAEILIAPDQLAAQLSTTAPFTKISAHQLGYEWIAPASQLAPPTGSPTTYEALSGLVQDASLVVVLTEGNNTRLCDILNEIALKERVRWLNVSLKGSSVRVGPGIVPYSTACWRCYQSRVWANQTKDETASFLEAAEKHYHEQPQQRTFGRLSALRSLAAGYGANEIIKALTLYWPALYGQLLLADPLSNRNQVSDVLRLPRCKACGRDRVRVPMKLWHTVRPTARGLNG